MTLDAALGGTSPTYKEDGLRATLHDVKGSKVEDEGNTFNIPRSGQIEWEHRHVPSLARSSSSTRRHASRFPLFILAFQRPSLTTCHTTCAVRFAPRRAPV